MNVQVYGFKYAAHTADTGVWLIPSEKVAHIPDLINADQLPYWGFAGAEVPLYFEENLKRIKKFKLGISEWWPWKCWI